MSNRRQRIWTAITGPVGVWSIAIVAASGIVLVGWQWYGEPRSSSSPDPEYRWLVPDQLPPIYTGEAIDVDGDGEPEGFLFGDPSDPTVESFSSNREVLLAIIAVVGGVIAALIGALRDVVKERAKLSR